MTIRWLKVALVLAAAAQAFIYALQNIANIEAATGAVGYVLSRADHAVYPNSIIPAMTSPAIVSLVTWTIITLESLAGLLAIAGAVRMAQSVNGTKAAFGASKWLAASGLMLMVFVWVGLFGAIGGALFQMWQTEVGTGSLEGAWIYAGTSALVLLIVMQEEPCWADRRDEA